MKITTEWLKKNNACSGVLAWFEKNHQETDGKEIVKKLMKNHPDWANSLIIKMMTYAQYVSYAIYAAEQVIDIYEKKYPSDDRPRLAILAAKKCLKTRSVNTANMTTEAVKAAAEAAGNAFRAAEAAAEAAGNAARTAEAVGNAEAAEAAYVASMAAMAAYTTRVAARAAVAGNAKKTMYCKILNYGLKLL